jgi:AraC-like DNA-binding protein
LKHTVGCWHRFDIRRIEDLANAVLGAELEASQMAGPPAAGSLAFAAHDGIIFSSGLIRAKVAVRGALSADSITLGLGFKLPPGSRHWLTEVSDGDVAVLLPGDEHDAIYAAGSLYGAVTLTRERLEVEADREELTLDRNMLARTGLHGVPIRPGELAWMARRFAEIHSGAASVHLNRFEPGTTLLRTVVAHYARTPTRGDIGDDLKGRARIVHKAREYIREHLETPISMDDLAKVTGTSRRSIYRAFSEVLDETPKNFVRRLRLHRIRKGLVSGTRRVTTISALARSSGFGTDMGRLAARYQQLFGESPSKTLADHTKRLQASEWF